MRMVDNTIYVPATEMAPYADGLRTGEPVRIQVEIGSGSWVYLFRVREINVIDAEAEVLGMLERVKSD